MPTQLKVWEVVGKKIIPVEDAALSAAHREAELEEWIVSSPSLIEDNLLILAKQHDVPGIGRLDLLCMDSDGTLVIVELKRDMAPREAVSQALDYASWLDSTSEEAISAIGREHLKGELDDAFRERFHTDPPEWTVHNHRILLVAVRLNTAAERIIRYLSERHEVNINAVFFQYSKLSDGKEILVRSVLVPDDAGGGKTRSKRTSREALTSMAAEQGTAALVQICRTMKGLWREEPTSTSGGSFRYWTDKPDGGPKMVFGVNVSGELADAPQGQLDVWIRTDGLAEVVGVSEAEVKSRLSKVGKPSSAGAMDFVLRLKNSSDAQKLVDALKGLVSPKTKSGE